MQVSAVKFVKESVKFKGNIDVKKTTAKRLKELEKKGVQINLLIADILDNLNYDEMFEELSSGEEKNAANSSENERVENV